MTSCECDSAESLQVLTCCYLSTKQFCNVFILVVSICLCGLGFHGTTSGLSVHFYIKKTPGLSGCICICQWSPSTANLSDPINNKNNILKVTQPKKLWDICRQLSRKCVSGSLDCYMFFISHGTERLAGFLIEIYIGVMVHSCFGVCMCGMFGHAHIRVKNIFCYFHREKKMFFDIFK